MPEATRLMWPEPCAARPVPAVSAWPSRHTLATHPPTGADDSVGTEPERGAGGGERPVRAGLRKQPSRAPFLGNRGSLPFSFRGGGRV